MPGSFATAGAALRRNFNDALFSRESWIDNGMAAAGGMLYPVIPTAVQRVTGWDMTGWKGALTGLLGTGLIGMATGQAGMTAGAIGAFTAHMGYAVLNGPVIYPIFGQYLFRWDPVANATFADDIVVQEGATTHTLPDGRTVPVYRDEAAESTTTMNDYAYSLPDTSTSMTSMSDYVQALPQSQSALSGYAESLSEARAAYGGAYGGFADGYPDNYM